MEQFIVQHQFVAGIAALWLFSAVAGALAPPTEQSSPFYTFFFKLVKTIAGDLGSTFGKYLPGAGTAAVIALLCMTLVFAPVIGCTQAQKISIAQAIVNDEPAITSAIDAVGAGVSEFSDPLVSAAVQVFVGAANTLNPQFKVAAQNYLANPSQTTLQTLQAVIVQIQNAVNSSLATLKALKVTNAASQQKAIADVNGVGTLALVVLGLIESLSTPKQVAAMSAAVTVHLAEVQDVLDRSALTAQLDAIRNEVPPEAQRYVPATGDAYLTAQMQAGF